jgi:phospholipase/carboxylesterase
MPEFSGTLDFSHPVPYLLHAPDGPAARTPLVIALHGMGRNEAQMRRALQPLLNRPWLWCFARAPLPYEVRKEQRRRIGHAWYVFDGDQHGLRESMTHAARFLAALRDEIAARRTIGAAALVGFSQGGYLAAYAAPQDPQRYRAAACVAGRIKWEFLKDVPPQGREVSLLQLHGGRDELLSPALARESAEQTRALGFSDVTYAEDPEAGHEITPLMVDDLGAWLQRVLA